MKKIFKIVIKDEDLTGMDAISLVAEAAVQRNFLKFADEKKMVFQSLDEEKHIISGVVALADTPIYRWDAQIGDYWVVFDAETIEKMVAKYSKFNLFNKVNLQHDDDTFQDGIYMVESYIVNRERGIIPQEFADVPNGSWVVSYKVENETLWNEIKTSGLLNGFSLQGLFALEQTFGTAKHNYNNTLQDKLKEIMNFSKLALRNLLLRFIDVQTDKGILTVDGELEVGNAVFMGEEIAENGEYVTNDMIIVVEDGKIVEIKPIVIVEPIEEPSNDEAVEETTEEVVAVPMAEEEPSEEVVEEEPIVDEDKDARIAELEAKIAELIAENNELKGKIAEKDAEIEKQEEQMRLSVEKLAEQRKAQVNKPVKKSIYAGLNR